MASDKYGNCKQTISSTQRCVRKALRKWRKKHAPDHCSGLMPQPGCAILQEGSEVLDPPTLHLQRSAGEVNVMLKSITHSAPPFAIQDHFSVYILTAMTHQTPMHLPRGRPRSFDTEAIVECFGLRGYHGTALQTCFERRSSSRGSLLCRLRGQARVLACVRSIRYIADALARIDVELGPRHGPVDGLRTFACCVDRTSGASGRRGCLLVATAMELAGHNSDVEARIRSFFKAMDSRRILAREVGRRDSAAGVEPTSAARILVCFVEDFG